MNIDCCFNHIVLNQCRSSGRLRTPYTKSRLFTKSKFTEYRKMIHCLYWALARTRNIFTKWENLLNAGTLFTIDDTSAESVSLLQYF
jgi:hypothetical protein